MKITQNHAHLLALCSCLLATLAQAATAGTPSRLDKHLAPIAEAAEHHVEASLMERALQRQSTHSNSPLEARWNDVGQVQVYLHYDPQEMTPDIRALEDLGATGIKTSVPLHVIQAWLPATALDSASKLPGITYVGLPRYARAQRAPVSGPIAYTGSVTTEGDQILGAARFRNLTGITGQGITVGVISDGDDHIAESQKTGNLPVTIANNPNDVGSFKSKGDEGTAMMEIIYDLAPGVKQLGFCGPQTQVDFLTCLDDFAQDIGANVIVDDLGFPGGPMFSDDDFNTGIQTFSKDHPNIRLVAATGNDGTGYWQGSWTPMTVATTVNGQSYTQAQNFDTSGVQTAFLQIDHVPSGDKIAYLVEWNDPWINDPKSTTANDPNDYDVVIFDNPNGDSSGSPGKAVACNQGININPNSGSCTTKSPAQAFNTPGPQPVQGNQWTASQSTYYLEVFQHGGTPGTNLKILVFDVTSPVELSVTPSTAGSVFGHPALPYPSEISVGAINASSALSGTYTIEPFSSQGPVEYGVTGEPTISIPKPDFVAPDCVSVSSAGSFPSPFCGTSAAAPHIAGLVALLMAGYPDQSPYTLLQEAATQPGTPDPNGIFGFGVPVLTNLLNGGILPVPGAAISAPANGTIIKTGQQTAFVGSCKTDGTTNLQYDWNFGGSGVADSSQISPKVSFNTAGQYTVTLKCTDSIGSGTADVSITVVAPPSGGGAFGTLGTLVLGLLAALRGRSRVRAV